MKTKELQFDGNIYICRIVKSNEGEELLIGSTALLDALHPGSFEDGKNYYLLCFAACCYLGVAISTTTAHCAMI